MGVGWGRGCPISEKMCSVTLEMPHNVGLNGRVLMSFEGNIVKDHSCVSHKSPGAALNNTTMTLSDLSDIKQLEVLFRIHTLLAQVTGTSSAYHTTYCLLAYSFVIRLWQVRVISTTNLAACVCVCVCVCKI